MQYTPHIRLPLFESTDKPTWLYDWNETMTKLDDVIYQINSSDIPAELAELVSRVNALERTVSQHTTDITELQDQASSILGDINHIMSIIPDSASPTNKLATMADIEGGSTPGIPIASATQLGGIKVGTGFTVDPVTGVANVTGGGTGAGNYSRDVLYNGVLTGTNIDNHWQLALPTEISAYGNNWREILNALFELYDEICVSVLCGFSPNPDERQNCKTSITINKAQFNRTGSYPFEQVFNDYAIAMTFSSFGGHQGKPRFYRSTIDTTTNYIDMSCCDDVINDSLTSVNKSDMDQVIVEGIKYNPTPAPPSGGEVVTITDPQVTSGASTLNAETLSITDVTPLS